jgi:hypothetical protein
VGEPEPYGTAKGIEDVIKAAARRAAAADPALTTDQRIRLIPAAPFTPRRRL